MADIKEKKRLASKSERMLLRRVYWLEAHKHPVRFVTEKVIEDYGGMNYQAAKEMGFPWPKGFSKKGYLMRATSPPDVQFVDLGHEHDEATDMSKGMHYWPAHLRATKNERESWKALKTGVLPEEKTEVIDR